MIASLRGFQRIAVAFVVLMIVLAAVSAMQLLLLRNSDHN